MTDMILRALIVFLGLACGSYAQEAAKVSLFSGADMVRWRAPMGTWSVVQGVSLDKENPKAFAVEAGKGVMLNNKMGKTSDLFTEVSHGDCLLHVEFCVPKGSNSGVYLQARYEVQIFDSFGKEKVIYSDCGGIYEKMEGGKGFPGKAPSSNASRAPGEWQTFDIEFRAPRFTPDGKKVENAKFVKVALNGTTIQENVEVPGPTRSAAFDFEAAAGPLMLQGDHGPVAFRNVWIEAVR